MQIAKGLKIDTNRLKLTIPSPSMLLYMLLSAGAKTQNLITMVKILQNLKMIF